MIKILPYASETFATVVGIISEVSGGFPTVVGLIPVVDGLLHLRVVGNREVSGALRHVPAGIRAVYIPVPIASGVLELVDGKAP